MNTKITWGRTFIVPPIEGELNPELLAQMERLAANMRRQIDQRVEDELHDLLTGDITVRDYKEVAPKVPLIKSSKGLT